MFFYLINIFESLVFINQIFFWFNIKTKIESFFKEVNLTIFFTKLLKLLTQFVVQF